MIKVTASKEKEYWKVFGYYFFPFCGLNGKNNAERVLKIFGKHTEPSTSKLSFLNALFGLVN